MEASLQCVVDPSRRAILDAEHRAFVNHEVYYVCDNEALRKFVAEPFRYTGKVTDPVSLVRFQPAETSPVRSFGGRLFYFVSNETARTFDGEPRMYGTPRPMMHPKT